MLEFGSVISKLLRSGSRKSQTENFRRIEAEVKFLWTLIMYEGFCLMVVGSFFDWFEIQFGPFPYFHFLGIKLVLVPTGFVPRTPRFPQVFVIDALG